MRNKITEKKITSQKFRRGQKFRLTPDIQSANRIVIISGELQLWK